MNSSQFKKVPFDVHRFQELAAHVLTFASTLDERKTPSMAPPTQEALFLTFSALLSAYENSGLYSRRDIVLVVENLKTNINLPTGPTREVKDD